MIKWLVFLYFIYELRSLYQASSGGAYPSFFGTYTGKFGYLYYSRSLIYSNILYGYLGKYHPSVDLNPLPT